MATKMFNSDRLGRGISNQRYELGLDGKDCGQSHGGQVMNALVKVAAMELSVIVDISSQVMASASKIIKKNLATSIG